MTPIEILGMIGTQDMILFFLVMLLLFGAKKLPELARGLGKTMGEFKKAREEFDQEINHAVTRGEAEAKATPPAAAPAAPAAPAPAPAPAPAAPAPASVPVATAAPAPTHTPAAPQ